MNKKETVQRRPRSKKKNKQKAKQKHACPLPHTLSSNIHGDRETEEDNKKMGEGGEPGTVRQKVTGMGKKERKKQPNPKRKDRRKKRVNRYRTKISERWVCVCLFSHSVSCEG